MLKNKKSIYIGFLVLSLLLFVLAMTVLGNTVVIAPVVIVISVYLFLGSLIKLCKTSDALKNTVLCLVDLLFWLP